MIRQTMEWNETCMESQCSRCPGHRSAEWREQVLAMTAAVTFFTSGIAVILLEGGLLTAVAAGLLAGGCALLLTGRALDAAEKRRLSVCSQL